MEITTSGSSGAPGRTSPEYEKDTARFVTEFGFQAPANRTTLAEAMLPQDRHPAEPSSWSITTSRSREPNGWYASRRHTTRLGTDFDDFIYKGQLVQAEALKRAAEHWRRRKFNTAGVLFWQLNDCWPVSSWAVIDSALRPKAAYYYAKRFFAPVLVSFKQEDSVVRSGSRTTRWNRPRASSRVSLRSFSGRSVWKNRRRVTVGANSSAEVLPR